MPHRLPPDTMLDDAPDASSGAPSEPRGGAAIEGARVRTVRTGHLVVLAVATAAPLPTEVARWIGAQALRRVRYTAADQVLDDALRVRPEAIIVDGRGGGAAEAAAACRRVKADSFTGIVPVAVVVDDALAAREAFAYGADEVLRSDAAAWEVEARLDALLRRAARDVGVHPTTRLPGTPEIEAELGRRLGAEERFAACYADLDHFKEFNDRYGYNEGDRVIRMVARILHDAVKGVSGEAGFVGHIGGDDFLFIVPLDDVAPVCDIIVETFELLTPYQYSEADRRAGYYFGKDRRGQLHRVPLMSLSIGIATNERRRYTEATQISRLASEMKTYAKAQPGSLYAVDRRTDAQAEGGPRSGDEG
ncbi:GGDEF domain-containing protein [Roseisolibacter agri]|uniref:GGDEF domain-containing protein n=1 Tax=Roseisolibacter agri TaxID=2014610 RepID=UPI0024E13915|nr:GGDEF domain-containing protein [Roseisolibacter agri]